MGRSFEQFVRFTTDAAGLERLFRLLQATMQILTSYTFPFTCLLMLLDLFSHTSTPTTFDKAGAAAGNPAHAATVYAVLLALKRNLALARRYFRLFRFLESFGAAQKLLPSLSSSAPSKPARSSSFLAQTRVEIYLDILSRTFNGMYLLLEASTLIDAQSIPGLSLWGRDLEKAVHVEGQRFWLFSLVCSALAGLVKIAKTVVLTPLPLPAGASSSPPAAVVPGHVSLPSKLAREKQEAYQGEEGRQRNGDENAEEFDIKKEQARLRAIVHDQKSRRRAWIKQVRSQVALLARRVLVDGLDTLIPGSVVGWIAADPGTVGLAMFVTTVLSSKDIWDRCGREVAG